MKTQKITLELTDLELHMLKASVNIYKLEEELKFFHAVCRDKDNDEAENRQSMVETLTGLLNKIKCVQ